MIGFIGEIKLGQELINPGIVLFNPEITRLEAQNFTHRKERIKHQFLRHNPERTARCAVITAGVMPQNADITGSLTAKPCHAGNQRCFTGTIGAQQPEEFTWFDIQ